MHYIEIGQDIIDAIKGGAGYTGDGEGESAEIAGTITDFSKYFAQVVSYIKDFVMEIYNAFFKK